MKKVIFVFLAAAVAMPAVAQPLSPSWAHSGPKAKRHAAFLHNLINRQYAGAIAEKPTAIKQRVIAQVIRYDAGADSTTFRYSGSRGSAFDFNNAEMTYRDYFDELYYPPLVDLFYGSDASAMLADSIAGYSDGELYSLTYAAYRDDNQIDSVTDNYYNSGSLAGSSLYLKNYTAEGHLTDICELSLTLAGYDSVAKQRLYYNNDFSRVLADTIWHYDISGFVPESSTQYYYSSTGTLDSIIIFRAMGGPLTPNEKMIITYSDDKVSTLSTYDLSMVPGSLTFRDSIGYEPGINYYTFLQEEAWDMGTYEGGYRYYQYPNSAGVPDSLTALSKEQANDPWEALGTLYYQYNSYNNPVSEVISYADSSPSDSVKYYYEEYDDGDTTSIKPVSVNQDFKVYPNPFSDRISIGYEGKDGIRQADIQLLNILGQCVFEKTIPVRRGNNNIIVPDVKPGNYFLILKTDDGQRWNTKLQKRRD